MLATALHLTCGLLLAITTKLATWATPMALAQGGDLPKNSQMGSPLAPISPTTRHLMPGFRQISNIVLAPMVMEHPALENSNLW
jgi:hypothetical protein